MSTSTLLRRSAFLFAWFAVLLPGTQTMWAADDALTPPPGSATRKAVCDAMRTLYPLDDDGDTGTPKVGGSKVVFHISHLRVKDGWAVFSGSPVEVGADGKEKMVVDAAHTAVLRLVEGRWKVVKDWLHGDVLTREEMVPKGEKAFPLEILPNWYE